MNNQVNRILEIMGVNNKLITEATTPIGSFAKKLQKLLTVNPTTGYQVGNIPVTPARHTKILRAITNNDLGLLDPVEIKILAQAISETSDPKIWDDIYEEILPEFLAEKGLSEKTFLQKLSQKKKLPQFQKLTWEQFLMGENGIPFFEKTDGTADDFLNISLSKKIEKRVKDFESNSAEKPFVTQVRPKLDPSLKPSILTPDQIKKFDEIINKSGRTFWTDIFKVFKKNMDTLKTELESLSKGFYEQYDPTADNAKQILNAYSVAISRQIDMMSIKNKKEMIDYYKSQKIPSEILDKLESGENSYLKVFNELRSEGGQGFRKNVKDSIQEILTDLRKLPWDLITKTGKTLTSIDRAAVQFFYTGQWASLSSAYRRAIKMSPGTDKLALTKYIAYATLAGASGYVVGSIILGIINFTIDFAQVAYNTAASKLNARGWGLPLISREEINKSTETTQVFVLETLLGYMFDGLKKGSEKGGAKELFSTIPIIGMLQSYSKSIATKAVEGIFEFYGGKELTTPGLIDFFTKKFWKTITGTENMTPPVTPTQTSPVYTDTTNL